MVLADVPGADVLKLLWPSTTFAAWPLVTGKEYKENPVVALVRHDEGSSCEEGGSVGQRNRGQQQGHTAYGNIQAEFHVRHVTLPSLFLVGVISLFRIGADRRCP